MTMPTHELAALCRGADRHEQEMRYSKAIRQQYLWVRALADTQGRIRSDHANTKGVLPAFSHEGKPRRVWVQKQTKHPLWKSLLQRGWVVEDIAGRGWRMALGEGGAPPLASPFDALDKPREGADYRFSARVAKALAETSNWSRAGQIAKAAALLRRWKKGTP